MPSWFDQSLSYFRKKIVVQSISVANRDLPSTDTHILTDRQDVWSLKCEPIKQQDLTVSKLVVSTGRELQYKTDRVARGKF